MKCLNAGLLNLKCPTKSRAFDIEACLGAYFISLKLKETTRKVLIKNLYPPAPRFPRKSSPLNLESIKTVQIKMITDISYQQGTVKKQTKKKAMKI